jgi:potassium channel LctB
VGERFVDAVGAFSLGRILRFWLWMVAGCGVFYWGVSAISRHGLIEQGVPLPPTLHGLLASIYFSFVTALSIGYGDVVPGGWLRAVAVAEGAAGLLAFGIMISKLVGKRQEEVMDATHRIAFEDRLGRVRTNLHLVLSDLQALGLLCSDPGTRSERVIPRLESAVAIFEGELRAVHDLLYRPQVTPEEEILESILASLAASLQDLGDLLRCLPAGQGPSSHLRRNLLSVRRLAAEICGECVPRDYAPDLKEWMDRIREQGQRLEV